MPIKLETIIAVGIAVGLCGSVAPYILNPIEEAAGKVCNRINPKIKRPIERAAEEIYDSFLTTGNVIKRFLYPDNLLNQQYYR